MPHNPVKIRPHTSPESCTFEYTDVDGTTHCRVFFAPRGGGDVYEDPSDPDFALTGLLPFGEVLWWDPTEHPTLADLIRLERRRGLATLRRLKSLRNA
jgi:hypothetical protein